MSAESGVPTFRDVETGLWAHVDPYEISSSDGWQRHPERVWAWYLWRHYMMSAVEPNAGHLAVAAWEDFAEVHVVTQNVDNLHERAGSTRVYHVHGSLFEFRCDRCQAPYAGELPAMPEPVEVVDPPRCACGGLIRPNVVWFGEGLPDDAWDASVRAVAKADVVIVVGTSSVVYPAAGLAGTARAHGAATVLLNLEHHDGPGYNVVRLGPASQVVPAWVDEVLSTRTGVDARDDAAVDGHRRA